MDDLFLQCILPYSRTYMYIGLPVHIVDTFDYVFSNQPLSFNLPPRSMYLFELFSVLNLFIGSLIE
jgi:hypothetical protein